LFYFTAPCSRLAAVHRRVDSALRVMQRPQTGGDVKLLVKFNLVFVVLFALGLGATGYISWNLLQRNAKDEVYDSAKLLIDNALAVRTYTSQHIAPLLETQMKYEFRPEMVSAYSALKVLQNLKEKNPEYKEFQYREPTLNPTNPEHRAVDWEADIINQFRSGTVQPPLAGERDTPVGQVLYLAKPLVAGPKCLGCHDTAQSAPPLMVEKYGTANGFGWKVNDIIGAQVVEVPVAVPQARARNAFTVFMGSLAAVLLAIGLILNLMLWLMIIRPLTRISKLADRISLGDLDAPGFTVRSHDEIRKLADSLARMRKSMVQALKLLES
jgi:protein-histidine pros-kinase